MISSGEPSDFVGAGFIPALDTAGVCDPERAGMNPAPTVRDYMQQQLRVFG
jgi:hypothetical protein